MSTNLNPDTRASLIARICDMGNEQAWNEFASIYQPVIRRFIHKHGLQSADADEIQQEVLKRVARSVSTWEGTDKRSTFRGWLYRITRNLTIDFLRKRKNEIAKAPESDVGLSHLEAPNAEESGEFQIEYEKQIFHWAAERLRPTIKVVNWDAFWLSTVEGVPIEEVARRLDISCSTVYVARSRIMARLAAMIQERLQETSGACLSPNATSFRVTIDLPSS